MKKRRQKREAPRIFRGDKRRYVVGGVLAVLKTYSLSKFEHEAACRHGLRAALCLDGHGWHEADAEARAVVAEALLYLGAVRPTWIEGQREYTTPIENCQNCGGPLDEADKGKHRRFCSYTCAESSRTYRGELASYIDTSARHAAHYLLKKERRPLADCAWCGKGFRPITDQTRFCSLTCAGMGRVDRVPEKTCKNCGQRFRGRSAKTLFCSIPCRVEFDRNSLPPKDCAHCGRTFRPSHHTGKYCGDECYKAVKAIKRREKREAEKENDSQFVCDVV